MFKKIMQKMDEIIQMVSDLAIQREKDYIKNCGYIDAWMQAQEQSLERQLKVLSKQADMQTETLARELLAQIQELSQKTNAQIEILESQTDQFKKEAFLKLEETEQRIYTENKYSFQTSASLYNAIQQKVTELNERLTEQDFRSKNIVDEAFGKMLMKNKWQLIDKYYTEPDMFLCDICDAQIDIRKSDKFESSDIFQGGILKRYRCPGCGAIVGPIKMLELSEKELGEEYRLHYALYNEGNTTEAEIRTFQLLHPQKGKKYLNYGCGGWSDTISRLRTQGYDVWGYDPYAPTDSEYVYNSMEQMRDLHFDGLFSHDLLEHLRYPVETFKIFHHLLTNDGRMAHATACYKYVYEYTRFHLFFYTGHSVETICKRAGFRLMDQVEVESDLYICNIFDKQTEVYI